MNFKIVFGSAIFVINMFFLKGDWKPPVPLSSETPFGAINRQNSVLCDSYQNLHIFWFTTEANNDIGSAIYYTNDVTGSLAFPNEILVTQDSLDRIHWISTAVSLRDLFLLYSYGPQKVLSFAKAPIQNAYNARSWVTNIIFSPVGTHDIVVGTDSTIHIVFESPSNDAIQHRFLYTQSKDNGETWSEPIVIYERETPIPSGVILHAAIDERNRIHVAITFRSFDYGKFSELGYLRSPDGGAKWEAYKIIEDRTDTFWGGLGTISVYAFGTDEIHLTFHGPQRKHQFSIDGGESWSKPQVIVDLGYGFGGENMLAKDSSGKLYVVVAYSDGVFVLEWINNSSWGNLQRISDQSIDPHYQQLVACRGNRLNVTYTGRIDQTVWYSYKIVDAPEIPQLRPPTVSAEMKEPSETPISLTSTFSREISSGYAERNWKSPQNDKFSVSKSISVSLGVTFFAIVFLNVVVISIILTHHSR